MISDVEIEAAMQHLLFKGIDPDVLSKIISEWEHELFPKDSIVIEQGETGDKIYLIVRGNAEAFIINKEGQEVVLAKLFKGDYFGELALLIKNGIRNCSIRCRTACAFLSLNKAHFHKLIKSFPHVSEILITTLGERLGETLHLVRERKPNQIVLLITDVSSEARMQHFMQYIKTISDKPIKLLNENITESELAELQSTHENHLIIVKKTQIPTDFIFNNANYIINFIAEVKNQICLTADVSQWKIESAARKLVGKTVGLALCSGGAAGVAHLGALRVLKAANVPIDYVIGTSVGAVVGGAFALGKDEDLYQILTKFINQSAFLSFYLFMSHISFKLSGFVRQSYYRHILHKILGKPKFEDTIIPFAAVTSDLYTGKTIILEEGDMVEAITASNAAPILVEPLKKDNALLIDGVASDPLPMQPLINKGIDIKIGVVIPQLNLLAPFRANTKLIGIFLRSRSMMAEQIVNQNALLADVLIHPNVHDINMNDWSKYESALKAGEEATQIALKKIQSLLKGHSQN